MLRCPSFQPQLPANSVVSRCKLPGATMVPITIRAQTTKARLRKSDTLVPASFQWKIIPVFLALIGITLLRTHQLTTSLRADLRRKHLWHVAADIHCAV